MSLNRERNLQRRRFHPLNHRHRPPVQPKQHRCLTLIRKVFRPQFPNHPLHHRRRLDLIVRPLLRPCLSQSLYLLPSRIALVNLRRRRKHGRVPNHNLNLRHQRIRPQVQLRYQHRKLQAPHQRTRLQSHLQSLLRKHIVNLHHYQLLPHIR